MTTNKDELISKIVNEVIRQIINTGDIVITEYQQTYKIPVIETIEDFNAEVDRINKIKKNTNCLSCN